MAKTTTTKRTRDEVFGDTLLDLGKLIFGGVILAGIFESEISKFALVAGGFVLFTVLLLAGIYLITKK